MFEYYPKGVCSTKYTIDIKDHKIVSIKIDNGCRGNAQGLSRLLAGMDIDDAIERLRGFPCRGLTSCPDQISKALTAYKTKEAANG